MSICVNWQQNSFYYQPTAADRLNQWAVWYNLANGTLVTYRIEVIR